MATIEKQLKNTLSTAIQHRFEGKLPIKKITITYTEKPRGFISKAGWVVRVQFEGDIWHDEAVAVWLEEKFGVDVLTSRSQQIRRGAGTWGGRGHYHSDDMTTTCSYWLGKVDLKLRLEDYR